MKKITEQTLNYSKYRKDKRSRTEHLFIISISRDQTNKSFLTPLVPQVTIDNGKEDPVVPK